MSMLDGCRMCSAALGPGWCHIPLHLAQPGRYENILNGATALPSVSCMLRCDAVGMQQCSLPLPKRAALQLAHSGRHRTVVIHSMRDWLTDGP